MQAKLEAALAELVLGKAVAPSDETAVREWLARHDVDADDAAAILDQGIERFLVYRSLVRATLEEALDKALPRTLARLGTLGQAYFDGFLADRGPRTHYLRDVTNEFLDYCAPQWAADARVPSYLIELARHEALHLSMAAAPRAESAVALAPLDLQSGLAFIEAARLVHYDYAVHELPSDPDDRRAPECRKTSLFVYRGPEHDVRYLELTPLAASILEHLLQGETLGDSLSRAAAAHEVALDAAVLTGAAHVLADLSARGTLLGPCRPKHSR